MSNAKIYHAVIYCRISRDDGDKSESDSISNQKELIAEFVKNKSDIKIVSVRVDDGYTGVNFERPAFKEMMKDIKDGKINCVIVKDLSRFSRDYIDAGKYLDNVFPFMGVRFIAVNDNFDSLDRSGSDNIIVPFKNLLNDAYCKDISVKTRTNLEIKRKRGEYISPFAPYGYKKSEDDKNKIVIDKPAADVVKNIFKWRVEGLSTYKIADKLNEKGLPTPAEYKKLQGMKYKSGFNLKSSTKWTHITVTSILKNIIYTGTLVQGKTTTPNHKVKKRITKSGDEWVTIPDNHQPVVSKEIFDTVNSLFEYDTKTAPGNKTVYPLSGKLFCSDCGGNLIRKSVKRDGKEYVFYTCALKLKDKNKCTSHRIKEKGLEECILVSIRNHIDRVFDVRNTLKLISGLKLQQSDIELADTELKRKTELLGEYKMSRETLAKSCMLGIISRSDFNDFSKVYDEKISVVEKNIADLKESIEEMLKSDKERFSWIDEFIKYGNVTEINRNIVVTFIDRIIVHEGNKVEIIFTHRDEYESAISFIENSYEVAKGKLNTQ